MSILLDKKTVKMKIFASPAEYCLINYKYMTFGFMCIAADQVIKVIHCLVRAIDLLVMTFWSHDLLLDASNRLSGHVHGHEADEHGREDDDLSGNGVRSGVAGDGACLLHLDLDRRAAVDELAASGHR